jgi:cysteinyl-tRNA synthetase
MKLSLFNTLSKKIELFTPINDNLVRMYVCGPTVYDRAHLGNARSVVIYDILYRTLIKLFSFDKVCYVRNITDVDDKIIERASQKNIAINQLTKQTTEYFHEDMAYLNCLKPNIEPKATEHINDMINIIKRLIALDYAYEAQGHVYFSVNKCQDYGKLSGQQFAQLIHEVRKHNSPGKKDDNDFVLWKPAQANDDPSAVFQSPFGPGRPGWHIECSAMSYKFLGESFDIHGGGSDLIFPHHTNEIAQSCCAFPGSSYAKIWVHNGFLTANHEKMSKSLGNFFTIEDVKKQGTKGEALRLFFLSGHYHKPLDYNKKAIADANHMLNYWYRALENTSPAYDAEDYAQPDMPSEFMEALLDDLNTPKAIKIINDYAKKCHASDNATEKQSYAKALLKCGSFLGLMQQSAQEWFTSAQIDATLIEQLMMQRKNAKLQKQWQEADRIRSELQSMGINIEDHADGTSSWKKI